MPTDKEPGARARGQLDAQQKEDAHDPYRSQSRPAGIVTLGGALAAEHAAEILNLVRNEEAREATAHPLQRIIAVKQENDQTVITTTDVHLARRIGDAVAAAYGGTLQFNFGAGEYLIRINWQR